MIIITKINEKTEKKSEKSLKLDLYLHGEDFKSKNIPRKKLSKFAYIKLKIRVLNREVILLRRINFLNLRSKIFIRYFRIIIKIKI
jgi:hypothetical protein